MRKIKVSDAAGIVLDYLVAKCRNLKPSYQVGFLTVDTIVFLADWDEAEEYSPSTDWAQGGPIIEREMIDTRSVGITTWRASLITEDDKAYWADGPTPLITAMRCYVASKLGDEVEIPEELV